MSFAINLQVNGKSVDLPDSFVELLWEVCAAGNKEEKPTPQQPLGENVEPIILGNGVVGLMIESDEIQGHVGIRFVRLSEPVSFPGQKAEVLAKDARLHTIGVLGFTNSKAIDFVVSKLREAQRYLKALQKKPKKKDIKVSWAKPSVAFKTDRGA